jgi:putative addiction module component (TIGR02574 family)
MTSAVTLMEKARALSRAERMQLLTALWENLTEERGHPVVTREETALLDERLAEHRARPHETIPAAQAEKRLRRQRSS